MRAATSMPLKPAKHRRLCVAILDANFSLTLSLTQGWGVSSSSNDLFTVTPIATRSTRDWMTIVEGSYCLTILQQS